MQEKVSSQRKVHIDLLRIVACFCVVMIHVSAMFWYHLPIESTDWMICNIFDALSSFGVSMFVMVSGMLFLGREGEIDVKRLYRSNILRLAVIYCVWTVFYSLWGLRDCLGQPDFPWERFFEGLLQSKYHLWFVPMIIVIYMILPILKTWLNHVGKRQVEYFLLLFLGFCVGVDTLKILDMPAFFERLLGQMEIPATCGFLGYFVLGYYLHKFLPEKRLRRIIYAAGILGALGAVYVSYRMSFYYGEPRAEAFGNFSVFILLISVAVFTFFEDKVSGICFSEKAKKWIGRISSDTLGIYLIHLLIVELGIALGITTVRLGDLEISPLAGIPLLTVLWFVVSMLITAALRRIPVIGKYIC